MSAVGTLKRMIPGPIRQMLRGALRRVRSGGTAPTGYEPIARSDLATVTKSLDGAWQDPAIPSAQLELVEQELARFARHEPVAVYDVFLHLLERIPDIRTKSLLEIGCSSGYYCDVLRAKGWSTSYAGCDFSTSFVTLARRRLPGVEFEVQDATRLTYPDASRDVVVSGCCILHIADYAAAIREAARVAREYVLFHRTPVLHLADTSYYRKRAYGVECLEIHFNETELLRLFSSAGLHVEEVETVSVGGMAPAGDVLVLKSYLCRK